MSDLMKDAMEDHWLGLKAQGCVDGVLQRENEDDVPLTLVPALRSSEQYNTDGSVMSSVNNDFIAKVGELQALSLFPPRRGDVFMYTDAAGIVRSQEFLPTQGDKMFDSADPYGVMIRIHTKEIDELAN